MLWETRILFRVSLDQAKRGRREVMLCHKAPEPLPQITCLYWRQHEDHLRLPANLAGSDVSTCDGILQSGISVPDDPQQACPFLCLCMPPSQFDLYREMRIQ